MKQKLILHLGFPKTGTTSLQDSFFPQVTGYLGKVSDARIQLDFTPLERDLSKSIPYYHSLEYVGRETLDQLVARLPFHASSTILISNEAFCRWPVSKRARAPWSPVQRPLPFEPPRRGRHPMVPFLAELREALPREVDLLTIITLRAQHTYLPSQAAQGRAKSMGPIIRRLTRLKDEYVLWDQVVQDLEQLRGPSKHLTLLFEDGLEANARRIVEFGSLAPKLGIFDFGAISQKNVRSTGSSWEIAQPVRRADMLAPLLVSFSQGLFGREFPFLQKGYRLVRAVLSQGRTKFAFFQRTVLRLNSRQHKKLDGYVRHSNKSLEKRLGRDLGLLGYLPPTR